MSTASLTTPVEIDTALADKWHEIVKAEQQLAYNTSAIMHLAGAKYYYRGRKRVTDMTLTEAIERVTEAAAYIKSYKAAHTTTKTGEWDGEPYDYESTNWDTWDYGAAHGLQPREADEPAKRLAERVERERILARLVREEAQLQERYTGWSRFFVVTSSTGHIHSSMSCSTCRPTTTYGWLPELSGKTEAEAVEAHGPALCSVCFSSAPVEWVGGKITKAQAEKRAA